VTGAEVVEWREGVRTRLHAATQTGATQLCVFEQWCEPGRGAPTHHHLESEEAIVVLEGNAELRLGERVLAVHEGETVIVPPHVPHGFTNTGPGTLRTLAVFGNPCPPVVYADEPDVVYEIGATGERRRDPHRAIRGAGRSNSA
jgi:quercetin dioxygenase-like cupin family protein